MNLTVWINHLSLNVSFNEFHVYCFIFLSAIVFKINEWYLREGLGGSITPEP